MKFLAGQLWRQKKGFVELRIVSFCLAHRCQWPDLQRELHTDHVHVKGWNLKTDQPTNHTVISTMKLLYGYQLGEDE